MSGTHFLLPPRLSTAFALILVTGSFSPVFSQEPESRPALTRESVDLSVRTAVSEHKSGDTRAAIDRLSRLIASAPIGEPEVLPAKLRLGYLYMADGDKDSARQAFSELAQLPAGDNDAVRGEAALRLTYLSTGSERGVLAERILAGQYTVPAAELPKVHNMAAAEAQRRGDLRRAVTVLEESPALQSPGTERSHVLKELAGMYFEMAKGEGKDPIVESVRSNMFNEARNTCLLVLEETDVPDVHRAVAELMFLETYWFEQNYEQCYMLIHEYLAKWGTDPSARSNQNERKYIHTAKTLLMQVSFVLDKIAEAEALADHYIATRPPKGDEFPNSDSLMIALVTKKLCAHYRDSPEERAEYGLKAEAHRKDYLGTQNNLMTKRAQYLARGRN